jgi:hypothetical protein
MEHQRAVHARELFDQLDRGVRGQNPFNHHLES